jgi:hypothetical protein
MNYSHEELLKVLHEASESKSIVTMPPDEKMRKMNKFFSTFTPDFIEKMLVDLKEKSQQPDNQEILERLKDAETRLQTAIKLPEPVEIESEGKIVSVIPYNRTRKSIQAAGFKIYLGEE